MEKLLSLEIISPLKKVYSGMIKSVTVPGELGQFQILYNHAPIISMLGIGLIKIVDEKNETILFSMSGGIIEVKKNKVTVLAEIIESKDEIDIERVKNALERAEKRISSFDKDVDREKARLAILRAKNRLKLIE